MFPYQAESEHVNVYVDSDYAGCRVTRKSTSGGCVMIGDHFIRGWTKTQATIALSSGEAELMGMVRGTCEALGAVSLARDPGINTWGSLYTDSGAALGIAGRAGAGKVRHLDTSMLWIQQKQMREEVVFDSKGVGQSSRPMDQECGAYFEEQAIGHDWIRVQRR